MRRQAARRQRAEEELRENQICLRTISEHQARLEAEHLLLVANEKLQLARQVQQHLLPGAAPVLPGLDVGAVLHSADATSGGFYDYVTLPDGSLGLIVAECAATASVRPWWLWKPARICGPWRPPRPT